MTAGQRGIEGSRPALCQGPFGQLTFQGVECMEAPMCLLRHPWRGVEAGVPLCPTSPVSVPGPDSLGVRSDPQKHA